MECQGDIFCELSLKELDRNELIESGSGAAGTAHDQLPENVSPPVVTMVPAETPECFKVRTSPHRYPFYVVSRQQGGGGDDSSQRWRYLNYQLNRCTVSSEKARFFLPNHTLSLTLLLP